MQKELNINGQRVLAVVVPKGIIPGDISLMYSGFINLPINIYDTNKKILGKVYPPYSKMPEILGTLDTITEEQAMDILGRREIEGILRPTTEISTLLKLSRIQWGPDTETCLLIKTN